MSADSFVEASNANTLLLEGEILDTEYRPNYVIQGIALKDYFHYHYCEPDSPRAAKHRKLNKAAEEFATVVCEVTEDPNFRMMALQFIQQARMFTNQAITFDTLPKHYSVMD